MDERLLTVREAAAVLGVGTGWLYGRTRLGPKAGVPHVRVGRYVRFRRADLDAWLSHHTVGAPRATADAR